MSLPDFPRCRIRYIKLIFSYLENSMIQAVLGTLFEVIDAGACERVILSEKFYDAPRLYQNASFRHPCLLCLSSISSNS
jgi:hypothetical protein